MQPRISEILILYLSGLLPNGSLEKYRHHQGVRVFRQDEALFTEGSAAAAAYLLCSGEVALVRRAHDTYCHVETILSADILGLPSVLLGTAHNTTAIARNPVHTFEIPKEELLQFLREHPRLHLSIAEKLCKKVLHYEGILFGKR